MWGWFHTVLLVAAAAVLGSCGDATRPWVVASNPDRSSGEAGELLRQAHYVEMLGREALAGQVRMGARRFAVGVRRIGDRVEVTYKDPEEGDPVRLHSRWERDGIGEIYEMIGDERWPCSSGRLRQSVGGSDLSHEDLMLGWLTWPGAVNLGEERLEGVPTVRLEVRNPDRSGQYGRVEVWLHRGTKGLVQAIGFDRRGQALRRLRVEKTLPARGGLQLPRVWRVERMAPGGEAVASTSYLEIERPALMGKAGVVR